MEEKFLEATKKWYQYVSQDHHKDRDCHWYLKRVEKFSYGDKKQGEEYWEIEHTGYIADNVYICADSREEVLQRAIYFIEDYIKKFPYEKNNN